MKTPSITSMAGSSLIEPTPIELVSIEPSRQSTGLAVMLCRHALPLAKECLKSLLLQTYPINILIVNNDGAGVAQWTRSIDVGPQATSIRVMHFPHPRSVSACWNQALNTAWRWGCQEALVVNDDAEMLPETFKTLKSYMDSRRSPDGIGMVTCVGRRNKEEVENSYGPPPYSSRPHPDFSCYMIARWAYEKVGKFDESFEGAYCEDNDYHVRMHQAGVGAVCIDLPFLHHACGALKFADPRERAIIESRAQKNRDRFRQKWGCYPGGERYELLFA